MELKQLTQSIKEIFNIAGVELLPSKLYDICINNEAEYYDAFVALVEDLHVDWMQKIFQYYHADRKEKKQDYTPASLSKLIGKLTEHKEEKAVYDLCAGSGSLTIQKWNLNNGLQFVCYEYDENVIPYLLFNLAVRNIEATVIQGDALKDEILKVYKLRKTNEYSSVSEVDKVEFIECDSCISNPPYNMKWEIAPFATMQNRFNDCELPPESNSNYAFILTAINNAKSKISMILPCGVLTTENKQEREIRKHLIEKNLIESIIACPDKMFEATQIPTCIVTFSKIKANAYMQMIDMKQTYMVEQREQNGQYGGASHEGRTYTKGIKTFSDEQIYQAIDCINSGVNIKGFSQKVSIQDIVLQYYNLTPARYIEREEIGIHHREYGDIVNDINRVISDKNILKFTVNETIAKSIGIYDLYVMHKQSEEISESMNSTLKFIGKEIKKENYISVSKNKNEIKFENSSKDQLSTILMSIMQMWKQHIMYLNNEENRYLIELRDAVLPDLMSGKLEL